MPDPQITPEIDAIVKRMVADGVSDNQIIAAVAQMQAEPAKPAGPPPSTLSRFVGGNDGHGGVVQGLKDAPGHFGTSLTHLGEVGPPIEPPSDEEKAAMRDTLRHPINALMGLGRRVLNTPAEDVGYEVGDQGGQLAIGMGVGKAIGSGIPLAARPTARVIGSGMETLGRKMGWGGIVGGATAFGTGMITGHPGIAAGGLATIASGPLLEETGGALRRWGQAPAEAAYESDLNSTLANLPDDARRIAKVKRELAYDPQKLSPERVRLLKNLKADLNYRATAAPAARNVPVGQPLTDYHDVFTKSLNASLDGMAPDDALTQYDRVVANAHREARNARGQSAANELTESKSEIDADVATKRLELKADAAAHQSTQLRFGGPKQTEQFVGPMAEAAGGPDPVTTPMNPTAKVAFQSDLDTTLQNLPDNASRAAHIDHALTSDPAALHPEQLAYLKELAAGVKYQQRATPGPTQGAPEFKDLPFNEQVRHLPVDSPNPTENPNRYASPTRGVTPEDPHNPLLPPARAPSGPISETEATLIQRGMSPEDAAGVAEYYRKNSSHPPPVATPPTMRPVASHTPAAGSIEDTMVKQAVEDAQPAKQQWSGEKVKIRGNKELASKSRNGARPPNNPDYTYEDLAAAGVTEPDIPLTNMAREAVDKMITERKARNINKHQDARAKSVARRDTK